MTPVSRIAEIRKRLEAATPGRWIAAVLPVSDNLFYVGFGTYNGGPVRENDAEFIAESPTDIAFLLEQLDLIPTILKKYNIDHFGKCSVRHKLPCSCGRDEAVYKLKRLFGDDEVK